MATEYLVEMVAYDPGLPGTVTLRYSTHGKVTGPAETPANAEYDARLREPGDIRRSIYEGGDGPGPVRIAVGDLLLVNTDGALDGLADYAFDGRNITVRRGPVGGAYPSDYPAVYVGTMDDVEVTRSVVRVRLRDNTFGLDVPVQDVKFDGDNVDGAGLEGTEEIEGVPKPIVLGRVQQIAPVPVNAQKLIYQVSDKAVQSVDGVFDAGVALGLTPYGGALFDTGISGFEGRSSCVIGNSLLIGGFDGFATPYLLRTTDGVSFSDVTPAFGSESVESMATNGSRVVAVGLRRVSSIDPSIFTSDDEGATWTARSLPAALVGAYPLFLSVKWHEAQGVFAITGQIGGGAGVIVTSPDGITWTNRTTGVNATLWDSASDGDRIAACGQLNSPSNAVLLTSTDDGVTWGTVTVGIPITGISFNAIAQYGGRWVMSGGGVHTSDNFRDWTTRDTALAPSGGYPNTFEAFFDDVGGRWVLGGQSYVLISPDGESYAAIATEIAGSSPVEYLNPFSISVYRSRYWMVGIHSFGGVSGLAATPAPKSYANATELEDDTLAPIRGSYGVLSSASGTYIRLGSPPAGLITADVTQGATTSDRTAAALFEAVLTRAGYTSADWVAADLTALDTADNSELGLYIGDEMPVRSALDAIAATVGAWWGVDADGKFRIQQFTAPSGTPALTLTANDITAIERLPSVRPSYSTKLQYARYHAPQAEGVALGVSAVRRAELAREWREVIDTDPAVQTAHLLAVETTEQTLYQVRADALAEAQRRQALRGVKRDRFDVVCELNAETEAVDVGDVVTVEHPRFGLSAGVDFRVVSVEPQRATKRLRLGLWG